MIPTPLCLRQNQANEGILLEENHNLPLQMEDHPMTTSGSYRSVSFLELPLLASTEVTNQK